MSLIERDAGGVAVLDTIADVVLRYRPKPVSDAAKKRKKKAKGSG
jgi:hypothetical protein